MAVWSDKFVILRDSFQETPGDRVIRSQMDVGPAKKRRRSILAPKSVNFTVKVEIEDYDEFENFYLDNDIGVFDFKHPRTGQMTRARFVSVPTASLNEVFYTIPVQLEILP